jgi:hypothetical protein
MIEGEMSRDDTIRASDAERDAVIETLRRHTADGRLTMSEFEDRVAEALAARTRGDLAPVLRELPSLDAPPAPRAGARRQRPAAWLPRVAIMAIVAVAALVLFREGAWWLIFPLFWVLPGMARGGGACGSQRTARHPRARHDQAWHGRAEREHRETIRV